MAGTKRASDVSNSTARASKVAKTRSTTKAKKETKNAMPHSSFKAKALPLHINVTHTPPTISEDATDALGTTGSDIGFIGNLTLVPTSFATGSYGWKGSKRITVELQDSEGGSDGKEKVHVMLTVNATVVGSKQADEGEDDQKANEQEENSKENEESHEAQAEETGEKENVKNDEN